MIQRCVSRSYRNDTKGYGKTSSNFSLFSILPKLVYFLLVFQKSCQPFLVEKFTVKEILGKVIFLFGWPPKIVWVRFGNQTVDFGESKSLINFDAIEALSESQEIEIWRLGSARR